MVSAVHSRNSPLLPALSAPKPQASQNSDQSLKAKPRTNLDLSPNRAFDTKSVIAEYITHAIMVLPLLLGAAAIWATPLVPATLGIAGFGAAGIAAGSLAAVVQGPVVAAGSAFAVLQSAGAGGTAALLVLKGAGTAVVGAVAAVAKGRKPKCKKSRCTKL